MDHFLTITHYNVYIFYDGTFAVYDSTGEHPNAQVFYATYLSEVLRWIADKLEEEEK